MSFGVSSHHRCGFFITEREEKALLFLPFLFVAVVFLKTQKIEILCLLVYSAWILSIKSLFLHCFNQK